DQLITAAILLVHAGIATIDQLVMLRLGQRTDLGQTGIRRNRPRSLAHQLEAVVIDRVVRGSDLDTAVHFEVEGGKVDLFGADHTEVEHIHTLIAQPIGQRSLERGGALADISTKHDTPGFEPLGKGPGDAVSDIFVQLSAQLTADVVGFEAGDLGHAGSLFLNWFGSGRVLENPPSPQPSPLAGEGWGEGAGD